MLSSSLSSSALPVIEVVAGVLTDARGRILLTRRRRGGPHAGLWEFPGGKQEHSESSHAALARELREELGIEVFETELLHAGSHDYASLSVALTVLSVRRWSGVPAGLEGQALSWVGAASLRVWPMPAADRPAATMLVAQAEGASDSSL